MTFKPLRIDQRIIRFSLALVLFAILLAAVFVNPENYQISSCFIHDATGYSCPSCGLSRSLHAGANLHLWQSLGFHIMGPFLLLGMIILLAKLLIESYNGKAILLNIRPAFIKLFIILTGLIWAMDWIVRLAIEIGIA